MPDVRMDAELAAVRITAAIGWIPLKQRRDVIDFLVPDVKQIVISLSPDLWPDPDQCPDTCG